MATLKNLFSKYSLITSLLIFSSSIGFSQSTPSIPTMESQSRIYFEKMEFYKALKLFLALDSVNKDSDKDYSYYIGVCYTNSLKANLALPYFEKCLLEPLNYPRNLHYYTAKAYQLTNNFDSAIVQYQIYKEDLKFEKKKKRRIELSNEIDRELASCNYAKELISTPIEIKIHNLGDTINTSFPEYGPVLSADQQTIIFTSARPETTGGSIDPTDGTYYEDIYFSNKTENGWSIPQPLGQIVNTEGHDASISLSPDGQKLLIYRNAQNIIRKNAPGNLFITKLNGNEWSAPEALPSHINSKSWEPSACYSYDEKTLIFSSNKKNGKGGTDLYMVKLLPNGEWALPMNMGNKINTPFDEDSPFLHPDGKTLYFSSNGHKNMGGFDIFVSRYNEEAREWSAPQNIGYPINTSSDDIHFSFTADGKRVYFSSIRPEGKGENDIYYADINATEAVKVVVIKGIVTDSLENLPKEAEITVYDNLSNELVGIYTTNSATGKYIIILKEGRMYNISIEAPGYKRFFENYDTSNLTQFEEITKNVSLVR